jgi:predicted ATPase/class 3 adenylate cyclase
MPELPEGTITFLFTDIEGSTIRWERFPDIMRETLARHDALLRVIMDEHRGIVFKTVGDAFYVAFASAGEALSAAVAAQQALVAEPWHEKIQPLRVRMALHTGEAEQRGHDYFGQVLNRVARILSTGHGGQVLLSQTTLDLVHGELAESVTFRDLGRHRLKDIQYPVQIFQLIIADLPEHFSPLKSLDLRPHNLPAQLANCVGREIELSAVSKLLLGQAPRMLTLIGPGGIGKTRFGLYVATSVIETFPDGIWFVELATIRDVDAIIPAIFQAMGIYEKTQQLSMDQLKERLDGRTLLFLDSVEQVSGAEVFISDLLQACPRLKLLVTSRGALQLSQEYVYQILPLALPEVRRTLTPEALLAYGAVALFVQQAQIAKPAFTLNRSNTSTIMKICKRLDGLPLAIELAAARIKILSLQTMLKRLDHQLQLLAGSEKQQTHHQQTLRGTIAWSYNLLSVDEKALLSQLAIFRSGCTFEAIEAICTAVAVIDTDLLDLLRSLLDKSLLRQQEGESGEPRFRIMYIIREYALEQLRKHDETDELKQRHADYYLTLVEQVAPTLTGVEQKSALAMLEEEQENVQGALSWFLEEGALTGAFRMVDALWRFWWMHGHINEGLRWLDMLLSADQVDAVAPMLHSRVLVIASRLASSQNDYEQAALFAEQALVLSEAAGDKRSLSSVYTTLAEVSFHKGAYVQATELLEKSLVIQRALGERRDTASLLNNLGNVALQQGDLARATSLQEESLQLFRSVKDQWAIATVLNSLGEVERRKGNHKQAAILYKEALKLCRSLEYTEGSAAALVSLGDIARYQGDHEHASTLYKESLSLFREMKSRVGITICLQGLAEVAYIQEQLELATRLFAQAEVTAYGIGTSVLQYEQDTHNATLDQLRIMLDRDSFEGFWTTGQSMTLEQVTLEVLNEAVDQP